MANQVDLTPATGAPFLHVHVPSGQSASVVNNPADIPAVAPNVGTGTGSKAVTVKSLVFDCRIRAKGRERHNLPFHPDRGHPTRTQLQRKIFMQDEIPGEQRAEIDAFLADSRTIRFVESDDNWTALGNFLDEHSLPTDSDSMVFA